MCCVSDDGDNSAIIIGLSVGLIILFVIVIIVVGFVVVLKRRLSNSSRYSYITVLYLAVTNLI